MDLALAVVAGNLLAPTILFFVLGLFAAFVKSDLSIPEGAAKFLSIYLLLAIGFKGGVSVADNGLTTALFTTLLAGAVLSFMLPFIAWFLLKIMTKLDTVNAAAVAGHYGSISIVTFVAAASLLETTGVKAEGFIVAVAAVMEIPAIVSALWLAARNKSDAKLDIKLVLHILKNGSIVLLTGAFLIGFSTGKDGLNDIEYFIVAPFTGVLCIFLLDMGLSAGRSIVENRKAITIGLFAFGCLMPLIGGLTGLFAATIVGLSAGGTFLMMTLAASASYIAVPAAMRIALPEAKPGIYLSLSLGITFPFNLTIGLPVYLKLAGV